MRGAKLWVLLGTQPRQRHHSSYSESDEVTELTETVLVEYPRGGTCQRSWVAGTASTCVEALKATCLSGEDVFGACSCDAVFLYLVWPAAGSAADDGPARASWSLVREEDDPCARLLVEG